MIESKAPRGAEPTPYTPAEPPDPLIFEIFDGINTQTSRPGVKDEQMWWCDGFMPIGPRLLRVMRDHGAGFTPAGGVVFFAPVNIGDTPYHLVFCPDGSIEAWNINTRLGTQIAAPGTIQNPSPSTTGISQWGSEYAIIVTQQANGFFLWNGATFYKPGDAAPVTGTMPTGVGGSAVETYQGRIWIANNASIQWGAPGSLSNFTTAAGGGSFSSSDSFLRVRYTQLRQTNGFLYLIGDSSVNYISNVQTTTTVPITTTFTNQNADPEVGSPWGAAIVFNRNILLANSFGVHVSYGAAITKISDPLDGVYNTIPDFGSFVPSVAKAVIFAKKVFVLLLPIVDPYTGQQTNKLLLWDSKRWWASSQSVSLIYIQSQEINSILTAWGTDGVSIYPLFQSASAEFTKVVQTKLWDRPGLIKMTKAASRLFGMFRYYSDEAPQLRISIDNETTTAEQEFDLGPLNFTWFNEDGAPIAWENTLTEAIDWTSAQEGIVLLDPTAIGQNGALIGLTLATEAADMALIQLLVQVEIANYRG